MVVVSATPHVRARWSFGQPQGLRALATLAFCVALTAFTLPGVDPLWGASGSSGPTFGRVAQTVLGFWAAGAGLILLLQAARSARAAVGVRVGWVLVTLVAGTSILLLIPLRIVLAEGRAAGDMAAWTIGLANAFVGLTVLLFGIDALRPRPVGRHAGLPRRPAAVAAPAMPVRARSATEPLISGVDLVAAGAPAQAASFGYVHTWLSPQPTVGRSQALPLSRVPRRMLYASELSLPSRVFAVLLALLPVIFVLFNLPKLNIDLIKLLLQALR